MASTAGDQLNNDSPIPVNTQGEVSNEERQRIGADWATIARLNRNPQQIPKTEPPPANSDSTAPNPAAASGTDAETNSTRGQNSAEVGSKAYGILRNPLHQYPNYTYEISLHSLTPADYNEAIETGQYTAKNVLIASSGRHNETNFIRNHRWHHNFYFDDFEMKTYIAPTEMNRNTNAIEISFKIIEPYSMTLVERLILTAKEQAIPDYRNAIYLLEINFFAYDDNGAPIGILSEFTKYIPISIVSMGISLTHAGAEYAIRAVPFNHSAYDFKYVSTPTLMEITATTVDSFFSDTAQLSAEQQETIGTAVRVEGQANRGANRAVNGSISGDRPAYRGEITASSYAAALNSWMTASKNYRKVDEVDVYKFEIDPDIAKSSITSENKVNHLDTALADILDAKHVSQMMGAGALGKGVGFFDPKKQVYTINAGTSIERVIDYIVRNSDYIRKQLILSEDYASASDYKKAIKERTDPLNWYKITTRTKILNFDKKRGVYAREITYIVKKFIIKNVALEFAPQGREEYPVKEYNFIYTGKNVDVLNLDINFNNLYYNATTVYKSAQTEVIPIPEEESSGESSLADAGVDATSRGLNKSDLMPKVSHPMVSDPQMRATGSVITAAQVAATELERYVLSKAGGDMIQVDLTIIGDPHFIKQDDIFYCGGVLTTNNNDQPVEDDRLTINGSLKTDLGLLYTRINFRVPLELREFDGLMTFDSKDFTSSIFSGIYYCQIVTSSFKNGEFTQLLTLVRAWNQEENIRSSLDSKTGDSTANRNYDSTSTLPPLGASTDVSANNSKTTNVNPGSDDSAAQTNSARTAAGTPAPQLDSRRRRLRQVDDTAPTQSIGFDFRNF